MFELSRGRLSPGSAHLVPARRSSAMTWIVTIALAAVAAIAVVLVYDRLFPTAITISPAPESTIVVSIEGAVATPGTVELPAGARLSDAVKAAGGLLETADLTNLNKAGRVNDGETITIPSRALEVSPVPGASPVSQADTSGLLNINTATVAQLDTLPGVGPVIAQRIVDFREFYGPFTSVDQLAQVTGISPNMVERLRPLVTIGG